MKKTSRQKAIHVMLDVIKGEHSNNTIDDIKTVALLTYRMLTDGQTFTIREVLGYLRLQVNDLQEQDDYQVATSQTHRLYKSCCYIIDLIEKAISDNIAYKVSLPMS